MVRDTLHNQSDVFDVLSAIYQCRSLDFNLIKINEKIPVKIVLDGKVYPLYVRLIGKEIIKDRSDKKYRCIKFSALLVEGSIFKGGEDMNIWVTDDENRVPVLVEAKILIGSVKVYLNRTEGLKKELRAMVK